MKRKSTLIIIAATIAFLLLFNPTNKSEYVSWVKEEMKSDAGFLVWIIGPIIDSSTTKQNYGLFTVYKTEFAEDDKLLAVGVLNNYIWLKGLPKE